MAPVPSKPVVDVAAAPLPANDNVAHAIAGAGGGILSTLLTYPLVTLSTRAQVQSSRAHVSFWAAVRQLVAREGVSGLYAGLDSAVFGIGLTNFIYYYWYEWTRALFVRAATGRLGRVSGQLTTVESMIAGAVAGSATVILTNPIWVVNTRMTTRQQTTATTTTTATTATTATAAAATPTDGSSASPAASVAATDEGILVEKAEKDDKVEKVEKDKEAAENKLVKAVKAPTTIGTLLALLREEGPRALFAGVVPALVLVINPILQYTLFEQLKNAVQARRRNGTPFTPGMAFVLGAISKLFATGITYPYITVKSRMHVAKEPSKGGATAVLRRIVREEGYAGLYKGIGPKVTQSVLTAAFLFAFKDVLYAQTVRLRSKARA